MRQSTRLMLNTGVTYARMLLTIGFALVSTRLFVRALGHDDYGAFMVLFAAAATVSILTDSLSSSLIRHLSYEIGADSAKSDEAHGTRTRDQLFSTAALLFLFLASGVVGVGFLFRAWFVSLYEMPPGREAAAASAFALIAARTFFIIAGVPFRAAATARQAMPLIAIFDVAAALVIFGGAIWLTFWPGDKLEFFAWMQAVAAAIIEIGLAIACMILYPECRIRPALCGLATLKRLFAFAGWALVGYSLIASRLQGSPMLLNRFFGKSGGAANTSWSLAGQVAGYAAAIGSTILGVAGPALIAAEGRGDRDAVRTLTLVTCKYTTLATLILVVPALFELEPLLKLWLTTYPDELPLIARILLLTPIVTSIAMAYSTAVAATGNLRRFTLIVHSLDPLAIVVAWAWFLFGHGPIWALPVTLVTVLSIQSVVRAWYVGRLIDLPLSRWFRETVWPVLAVGTLSAAAAWCVHSILSPGLIRAFVVGVASSTVCVAASWFIALAPWERGHFRRLGFRGLGTLQAFATGRPRPIPPPETHGPDALL